MIKFLSNIILFIICSNRLLIAQEDNSLEFDGVDDVMIIPHIPAYDFVDGAFTIEVIVKMSEEQNPSSTFLSNRASTTEGMLLATLENFSDAVDGDTYVNFNGEDFAVWSGNVPNIHDGLCHHIAYTRTVYPAHPDQITFVVDGWSFTTDAVSEDISTDHDIWIGWDNAKKENSGFRGQIKELRFWADVRSPSELAEYHDIGLAQGALYDPDLLGYWKMNEGTGQVIKDYSLNSNDAYMGSVSGMSEENNPSWNVGCSIPDFPKIEIIEGDSVVCLGDTITIVATGGDGKYLWGSDPLAQEALLFIKTNEATVVPVENISYWVNDESGHIDTLHVEVKLPPNCPILPINIIHGTSVVCSGTQDTIVVKGGDGNYLWRIIEPYEKVLSNNNDTLIISFFENTTLTVSDESNGHDTIVINMQSDFFCEENDGIHIYNVITPNGDGKNDFFYIQNAQFYPQNKLSVYNIWSDEVFSSSPYQNNWKGQDLPAGSYIYKFEYDDGKIIQGTFKLIR